MVKNHNNDVIKSNLTFNTDQNAGKLTLSPLNSLSTEDILSLSTSSLTIGEVQKHDPIFNLTPLTQENNTLTLSEGQSVNDQPSHHPFSWHETALGDNEASSNATSAQQTLQQESIALGDSIYESLIPIKPFQSNDFDNFQSDFQPGKIENNALDVANFEPPASNTVEIFYEAATDAEFAQAAGLKTQLELPSEFDYVNITADALPALTPELYDGRLIQEHPLNVIPVETPPVTPTPVPPQANPDFNSYTEGTDTPVTGNVVTNDSTNKGGDLTVTNPGTFAGTFGDLTLNQDGTYTYAPHDPSTDSATLKL